MLGPTNFWAQKDCGSKNILGQKKKLGLKKKFGSEKMWVWKSSGQKFFWFESFLLLDKNAGPKNLSLKTISGWKNLGLKKFCPRTFWPTKIRNPKKLGPKSLVKIGPVTAEILLIWTNVARTNVVVVICSRCSQEATFKVSSKSVQ